MELIPSDVEDKTFKVVRKGYDRDQVHIFLREVGYQMSGLAERAKIAAVRADQLEREIHDVRQAADNVAGAYQQALEARRKLLADAEIEAAHIRAAAGGDVPEDLAPLPAPVLTEQQASIEAQQILAEAREEASRKDAAAETVLQRALSASERIEDEKALIVADAVVEADEIRAQADRDANEIRKGVSTAAAETRQSLETEQRDLLEQVAQLQSTLDELETQKITETEAVAALQAAAVAASATASPATPARKAEKPKKKTKSTARSRKARPPAEPAPTKEKEPAAAEPVVTVDLTTSNGSSTEDLEPEPVAAGTKVSRYKARSANLPRIGDGAVSVLADMKAFRKKDGG